MNKIYFKKSSKISINNLISIMLAIFACISIFSLGNNDFSRICLIINFVILCCTFFYNFAKFARNVHFLFLINVLSCLCTLFFYTGTGVVIIFLSLLLSCIIFNSISFSAKTLKYIHFICLIGIFIFLTTASAITIRYDWLIFERNNSIIINNNTLAMLVVAFYYHVVLWLELKNVKYINIISTLVGIVSIVVVYIIKCRSALLVLGFYFILQIIIKNKFSFKSLKRILWNIFITALLFPLVYIFMARHMNNIMILGKKLFSGRNNLWTEVFEQIAISPIFGSGTSFSMSLSQMSTTESAHNMLLGIWKNVGIIPLMTLIGIFSFTGKNFPSKNQQIIVISMLIFMFFESFMMDSNLMLLFVLLLARGKENKCITNRRKEETYDT